MIKWSVALQSRVSFIHMRPDHDRTHLRALFRSREQIYTLLFIILQIHASRNSTEKSPDPICFAVFCGMLY